MVAGTHILMLKSFETAISVPDPALVAKYDTHGNER